MLKKESTDIIQWDIAVKATNVTKMYTQVQRENAGRGLLKNLIKPEKKIIKALDDVSFTIHKGEFVAYAGPNGAGKSTTMKLLSGMLLPNLGELCVFNQSPNKDRIKLMHKVGVLFGNRTELWWDHPISQSFEWKKVIWNIPSDVYERNLKMVIELLDLGELMKTFARELSLGQRMRADLAMMLLHDPELILLDEPTLGLDVVAKRQMIDFLKRINQDKKVTIIVTSHDMDDLEEMAQRVIMISKGKIAYDGTFESLRNITGSLSRLRLILDNDTIPQIDNCKNISSINGVCEYETDLSKTPINILLQTISKIEGIKDIEINKAPIEQIIVELFKSWKN